MIFYFDFVSPYAYLASTQVHALAARVGREVELAPILFAGLLKAHETKGPAEIPAKRAYLAKDLQRKAHALAVPPLVWPPAHPFNPLVALRVAPPRAPRRRSASAHAPTRPSRRVCSASRRCSSTARSSGEPTPSDSPRSTPHALDAEVGTSYGLIDLAAPPVPM